MCSKNNNIIPDKYKKVAFTVICVVMQAAILGGLIAGYKNGNLESTHPIFGLSKGTSVAFNIVVMLSSVFAMFTEAGKNSPEESTEEERSSVGTENIINVAACMAGLLMWLIFPQLYM